MEEKQFMIKFVNGEFRKYDDDRFRLEIEDGVYKVYSRIHKNVVLEIPDKSNILYIRTNIIKRKQQKDEQVEVAEPQPIDWLKSSEEAVDDD